jgi:hypothetical protein
MNNRPRKCLGYKTPFEVFAKMTGKDYFLNGSVALWAGSVYTKKEFSNVNKKLYYYGISTNITKSSYSLLAKNCIEALGEGRPVCFILAI